MIVGLSILLNSLGIIAAAVMIALLSRQLRRLTDDVTELQAAVDLNAVQHGLRPFFAPRYDLEIIATDEEETDDG